MRNRGTNRRVDGITPALLGALGVLIIGLVLSVVGARAIATASRERAETRFHESAEQAQAAVQDQMRMYFTRIRNFGAFVASGRQPTTVELRRYASQDRIFEDLPSLQSLAFIVRADPADAGAVRDRARAAHPDSPAAFPLPHAPGPYYLITDYVSGPADFGVPAGTDLSILPAVRTLIDRSAETGNGLIGSFSSDPLIKTLSMSVDIDQLLSQVAGVDFFIAVPIFDESGQHGPEHLLGVVAAPVGHFDEVLAGATEGLPDDLGQSLTVQVRSPGADEDGITEASAHVGTGTEVGAGSVDEASFNVMGVDFTLRTWSSAGATSDDRTSLAALVLGTLTAVLAAAVVFIRVRAVQGRTAMVAELEERREFEHAIVESVATAMVVLDHDGSVVMGNRRWDELAHGHADGTGAGAGPDGHGPYLGQLGPASADQAGKLAAGLNAVLAGERASVEMDVPVDRHGERRWFAVRATPLKGRSGGAVVMHTDITERQRSADDLQRRASRDGLTGLLNRTSLEARADDLLIEASRGGFSIGVLFIDLDDFKSVNDTYGHQVGDGVLRAAAGAIERTVRPGDSIGRMGGDEFVVLLGAGVTPDEVEAIASRLVFELSVPRTIDGVDIAIGASVGIAIVDDPGAVSRSELIRRADEAMYAAKESGGSRFATADA